MKIIQLKWIQKSKKATKNLFALKLKDPQLLKDYPQLVDLLFISNIQYFFFLIDSGKDVQERVASLLGDIQ